MISAILKKQAQINNKQRNKMRSSGEQLTVNNYYKNHTKPIAGFGKLKKSFTTIRNTKLKI